MSTTTDASQAVSITGLRHVFKDLVAVNDVSIDIPHGRTFGLLGPNGSGKSTVLSLLAGRQQKQSGEIRIFGLPLPQAQRAISSRVGVVFQSPALDPQLSARENLSLSGQMHGIGGTALQERISAALRDARLTDRADERVKNYSGGMKRRLDLARAMLPEPEMLLLDEPTAGLDEASFREFWSRLTTLREQHGLTVIVATHRPAEADYCDHVAILNHGQVVATDTPDALRRSVARDVLVLETEDVEDVASAVGAEFGLETMIEDNTVVVECEHGHKLIPRLVEALPDGQIRAISLRQPTLGDVFLKVTGESLHVDQEAK